MSAGRYDILCEQGATFRRTITWRTGAAPGTLVNLTGYTAKLQARHPQTGVLLVELTHTSGITLGGSAGTIVLLISATATNLYTPDNYVYDLELTSSGGEVTRLLEGHWVVPVQVTV